METGLIVWRTMAWTNFGATAVPTSQMEGLVMAEASELHNLGGGLSSFGFTVGAREVVEVPSARYQFLVRRVHPKLVVSTRVTMVGRVEIVTVLVTEALEACISKFLVVRTKLIGLIDEVTLVEVRDFVLRFVNVHATVVATMVG